MKKSDVEKVILRQEVPGYLRISGTYKDDRLKCLFLYDRSFYMVDYCIHINGFKKEIEIKEIYAVKSKGWQRL